MTSAICTIGAPSSRDATAGVVRSARRAYPNAALYVVGSNPVPQEASALDASELTAELGVAITDVLTPEEEFLCALPFALSRLTQSHSSVFVVLPGVIIQEQLTELETLIETHDMVLVTPSGIQAGHHGTPTIDGVLHHPAYISPVVFGVSHRFGDGLEVWKTMMAESFRHVMQASPGGLHEAALKSFLGSRETAIAGESTFIHLDHAALIATGHAKGPAASVVECNLLWELARLQHDPSYQFEPTADQLQFVATNRSSWLDGLFAEITSVVAETPAAPPPTPHERLVRKIRRASDPFGRRWQDRSEFESWLYAMTGSGLNRITHDYWISHTELRDEISSALDEPDALTAWARGEGVQELGVDLSDRSSPRNHPPQEAGAPQDAIAKVKHAIDWRWQTLAPAIPGHSKRAESRIRKEFSSERARFASPAGFQPDLDILSVIGPFRSESGLGQAARGTLDALRREGRTLSYIDTSDAYASRNAATVELADLAFGAYGDVNIAHVNPPELLKWSDSALAHRLGGRYNIGMWFWETTRLPDVQLPAFAMVDELWAASTYLAETFTQYRQVPVAVTGLAMDLPPSREVDRSTYGFGQHEFVFFFAFDALSSHGRKNPVVALRSFVKAFSPSFENVRFVMKVSNLDRAIGSAELRALAAEHESITLLDSYLPRDQVLDLMATADVYVSLHASEGFGLTLLEAMALGTPVICTGYSGNMDFTNDDNAWLVDYQLITLNVTSGPYPAGSVWASPSTDAAADLMRFAVAHPDVVAAKGKQAAQDAAQAVSLDRYAERVATELHRIL